MTLADLASGAARLAAASSHQLPLPEVVALAGLLRNAPLEGRLVGVGIESVGVGRPLSEPVAAAVPRLTDAVARAIRALGGRDTLPP
jgi:Ni,Fe-hydrogenase maturation factor